MRYRKRNVEISGRADVIKNIHSCTSEDIDENIKRRCPSGALHRGMLVYLRHCMPHPIVNRFKSIICQGEYEKAKKQ